MSERRKSSENTSNSYERFRLAVEGDESLGSHLLEAAALALQIEFGVQTGPRRGQSHRANNRNWVELNQQMLEHESRARERREVLVDTWLRSHDDPHEFRLRLRVEDLERTVAETDDPTLHGKLVAPDGALLLAKNDLDGYLDVKRITEPDRP